MSRKEIVYDLETYKNLFSFVGIDVETKAGRVFEISDRKDDRAAMFAYLRELYRNKYSLIGFNNVGFDYSILHYILTNKECTVDDIFEKAQTIIFKDDDDKWGHIVKDDDRFLRQVDLYLIHHFDNKARATSLKMIQFNMRSETIEDLPYDPNEPLTFEQMDEIVEYNKHDVLKTIDFYKASMDRIKLREELTVKYGFDCTNFNDTKIGKQLFINRLEQAKPGVCYKYGKYGRKMNQTKRSIIHLKDCILPYVNFKTPEFQSVKEWFQQQSITETKGVFTDILEHNLGDVAKYANLTQKRTKLYQKPTEAKIAELRKKHPAGWVEEVELKTGKFSYWWNWNVADSLNVKIGDLEVVFGVGGIHAAIDNTIFVSDENRKIKTVDVSSYYPNLSIKNRIYPEHLGELFCDIYEALYNERSKYAKGTAENAALKLALNGTYGDSNNQYSPLYDPQYTMSITINGQLLLCMLAERLMSIPTVKVIMMNTDGLEFMVDNEYEAEADEVCKQWEKLTKLTLEGDTYSKMCIANVNNYIAVFSNGKVKRKGCFEYKDLDWNKDHSMLVVPMAAEQYLVYGEDYDRFVRNHSDKFDFMKRVKVPRSSKLVSVDEFGGENKEQNICRYYASKSGIDLIKIMPPLASNQKVLKTYANDAGETMEAISKPEIEKCWKKGFTKLVSEKELPNEERRFFVEAGYKVKVCNNMNKYDGDIDYDYYINEVKKLVDPLILYQEVVAKDD